MRNLISVAAVVILATGMTASASNMGFKINLSFVAGQTNFVSLPWYCRVNGVDIESGNAHASDILAELTAAGASSVSIFWYDGTLWQNWSGGGSGQTDFALIAGEGYQVLVSPGINWIVVGSHNDTQSLSYSAGVTRFVSWPYHTTDATANAMLTEFLSHGASSCTLFYYDGTLWQNWSGGGSGQVDFAITPGTAYQVLVSPGVSFAPAHY